MLCDLYTAAGESLTGTPWTVYPRPQMKRDSYINLNGAWDFSVNYEKQGQIRLPFCPESKLSGIGKHYEEGDLLCYNRTFTLPEGRGRLYLKDVDAGYVVSVADKVAVPDNTINLVFLTEFHDTRFDAYGALRPITAARFEDDED